MKLFNIFFKNKKQISEQLSDEEIAPKLLSYRVANMQGIGTRQNQEDSFAIANAMDVREIKRSGLFAIVADGMGGMENGKAASETAVEYLKSGFHKMDKRKNIPDEIKKNILDANNIIYEKFKGQSGTTVIECIIYREMLYFASIGDSYLYLIRGGRLTRLNREQNYKSMLYLEQIENGCLDREDADKDPDGLSLSEFVGKDTIDDVDMLYYPIRLKDKDAILIASDGVGGVLNEQILLKCLENDDPDKALTEMENEILAARRVHQDNYTAVLIECGY